MADFNFYMQRVDIADQPIKNLEKDFDGLLYKEFKGLETYGKIKSVYTESFPETDELQVFAAETPIRDNIDLTLTLIFKGDRRRSTYHSFVDYISTGKIKYWDDVRNRQVTFILIESINPETDLLYGGMPYIQAAFNLKCINGQGKTT